jgi:ribonuclease T2
MSRANRWIMSLAILTFAGTPNAAVTKDERRNVAGEFDSYVLSYLWAPSLCQAHADSVQIPAPCTMSEQSFFVQGLWPQYEKGFPEFCQREAPRLNKRQVNDILDLIPDPALVVYDWERHGSCTGGSPAEYFLTVRRAAGVLKIPGEFRRPQTTLLVPPAQVEQALIGANPGLAPEDIALVCDKTRLREIRVCLTKDLSYRACSSDNQTSCPAEAIMLPAASR